jgi:hypothetical protein
VTLHHLIHCIKLVVEVHVLALNGCQPWLISGKTLAVKH